MDRRTVLKGGIVLAATSHVAAAPPDVSSSPMGVDDFLKVATPAETIRYHTTSLVEALAVTQPDKDWASFTELDLSKIMVIGRDRA